MDLYAYAQIGGLEHLLEENKIEIKRLRGLRLMTDQEPVTEEEANERIEHEKLEYAVNWLRQHSDCCWSSRYMYKHHKAFIYGKPDENGDREVVAIDFSKVHGKTRKHIKFAWKKIVKAYHAQYDMWNEYVGKNVLYVHARQGGGNRPWYPIDTKHPMYLNDVDDAWDCTYCDIYYDLDKAVKETE